MIVRLAREIRRPLSQAESVSGQDQVHCGANAGLCIEWSLVCVIWCIGLRPASDGQRWVADRKMNAALFRIVSDVMSLYSFFRIQTSSTFTRAPVFRQNLRFRSDIRISDVRERRGLLHIEALLSNNRRASQIHKNTKKNTTQCQHHTITHKHILQMTPNVADYY